jgi:DNA replication protein DnaC
MDAMLKRLNLANARRVWQQLVVRAEEESWSYGKFLEVLIGEEVAHRQCTRLQRCTAQARFPFLKTIDDFDFSLQSQLRLALLGSYLSPDFVAEGRNLILFGRSGRGKTHLAVAIAYRAIQNGFEALFTTAAALIDELSTASRQGRFQDVLHRFARVHVLVIDEVGYLTYGDNAANVLYHVVNQRHLARRPIILTTNKPPATWGDVLHDPDLAETIVDRILERGRFITVDGPSYRTRHIDPTILSPAASFSGIPRPEFSELPDVDAERGVPGRVSSRRRQWAPPERGRWRPTRTCFDYRGVARRV